MAFQSEPSGERFRPPAACIYSPALALSLTLTFIICTAQPVTPTIKATQDEEVLRVRTDLVTVPLFVLDRGGRRVVGLSAGDFELYDEGQRVEPSYFAAGAERVALLFLLDASGSSRESIMRQRDAALGLFERFGRRSRVALIHFDEKATLTLDFTPDSDAARSAFIFNSRDDSRTAIFDAALSALQAFRDDTAHNGERRIIVLISDGLDNISRTRPKAIITEARRRNISFYVIHLPLYRVMHGGVSMRRPSDGFRDLAEKTGGQFLVVGDKRAALDPTTNYDLRPVFDTVAADLGAQYVLGFHASDEGRTTGKRRLSIRLKAGKERDLRVVQLRETYTPNSGAQ